MEDGRVCGERRGGGEAARGETGGSGKGAKGGAEPQRASLGCCRLLLFLPRKSNNRRAPELARARPTTMASSSEPPSTHAMLRLCAIDPPKYGWTACGGIASILEPSEVRFLLLPGCGLAFVDWLTLPSSPCLAPTLLFTILRLTLHFLPLIIDGPPAGRQGGLFAAAAGGPPPGEK